MKMDNLAYENAACHVKSYAEQSERLMAEHHEAMDCRNCEAFLQMGIDAFQWLMRADRDLRLAVYREEIEYSAETEAALEALCRRWLVPCEFAERWVERQQARGYQMDNLEEFRKCVAEMSAIVENFPEGAAPALPEPIRALRDDAITELDNGQTAEFI